MRALGGLSLLARHHLAAAGAACMIAGMAAGIAMAASTEVAEIAPLFSFAGSVRATAMGGAGVGLVGTDQGRPCNGASLASREGFSAAWMHDRQAGLSTYGCIAASWNQVAVEMRYFDFGEIDETDQEGQPTGRTLHYYSAAAVASVGIRADQLSFLPESRFSDDIALGLTGKAFRAQLEESASGIGAAIDLAVLLRLDLGWFASPPTLGCIFENLLSLPVRYGDYAEAWPKKLNVGATAALPYDVLLAADMSTDGAVRFGVEWSPVPMIAARAGARSDGVWIWSLGVGVTLSSLTLDLALVLHPYLPAQYAASVAFRW